MTKALLTMCCLAPSLAFATFVAVTVGGRRIRHGRWFR